MDTIVVGIDVSKDKLDIAVRPSGKVFSTSRDAAGLDAVIARLAPLAPEAVAVEATGGFETVVAASLAAAGLPVVVVNPCALRRSLVSLRARSARRLRSPAQVRSFAEALGKRAKTDPIDAAVIALFAEATKPDIRPLPDEATRLLADLVARRRQIIQMIVAERQRQKRLVEKLLQKSIARLLKALQKELSALDQSIDDAVHGSPAWREKEDLLASMPGVGPVIARTLIAELPELGMLDRKEIAALAGLAPWARQSGAWRGKSCIGGGRACVRAALFMGALVAAHHNPALKAFRRRLVEAGKPKLVAIIAVAPKLLTISLVRLSRRSELQLGSVSKRASPPLNALLRDRKPWRAVEPELAHAKL